eukprot:m.61852 g.61852  ORF g.61852 m.61852 type:complete len:415 (+) comp11883_c0_seq2:52-1296(+)
MAAQETDPHWGGDAASDVSGASDDVDVDAELQGELTRQFQLLEFDAQDFFGGNDGVSHDEDEDEQEGEEEKGEAEYADRQVVRKPLNGTVQNRYQYQHVKKTSESASPTSRGLHDPSRLDGSELLSGPGRHNSEYSVRTSRASTDEQTDLLTSLSTYGEDAIPPAVLLATQAQSRRLQRIVEEQQQQWERDVAQLQLENDQLRHQLDVAGHELQDMVTRLTLAQNQETTVRDRLASTQRDLHDLQHAKELVDADVVGLQTRLSQLEAELASARRVKGGEFIAEFTRQDIQNLKQQHSEKVDRLTAALDKQREEADVLLNRTIKQLQRDHHDSRKQLKQQHLENLQSVWAKVETYIQQMQQRAKAEIDKQAARARQTTADALNQQYMSALHSAMQHMERLHAEQTAACTCGALKQ